MTRGFEARRLVGAAVTLALAAMAALALMLGLSPSTPPAAAQSTVATHLGVASCSGSTCHGRSVAGGTVLRNTPECQRGGAAAGRPECFVERTVRHDEILRWQEPSSPGGAHSRAHDVLGNARSAKIAQRLGIGAATSAPMCLGCHASPSRVRNDGVDCESCHGPARPWLAAHYALGASHKNNVRLGLWDLNDPKRRAGVCLDCHFGEDRDGRFVDHRIMAAGHPRIAFELDLFSTLQQHHDEDADYARRKGKTNNLRFWAVGQAMALDRALDVFGSARGREGVFPEFYFFDCHTCHRRIFDNDEAARKERNPARGQIFADGLPAFNDENMIMLAAAARVAAPSLAGRLQADSLAFHNAIAGQGNVTAARDQLRATARALADAFSSASFDRATGFAMIDAIASQAISERFTDYEGSVQAVMAVDTLLNAMVNMGAVPTGRAGAIRGDINTAYAAVRDPNAYRPGEFRRALGGAARVIRTLR